jgi:adenine phosphoribosyltransferase
MERLKSYIRDIPDFPKPGILFKDITPLVKNPATLKLAVHQIVDPFLDQQISAVAGMEARGFIFGALAAWELGVGFIPLRKPGKLPYNVHSVSYDLEYGSTALEAHIDALEPGDRILLVDDLLATGGTAKASCELIEQLGAEVAACAFVVELDDLCGRQKIGEYRIHSLLHYSDLF